MKKLFTIFAAAAVVLGGCTLKKIKPLEEMPADAPWNRLIIENENGYYYSSRYMHMGLRYVEKSNGTDIYLCAKPECSHEGQDYCTATYKNLSISNYVMCDGSIYFAADIDAKDTMGISLYILAPDGSSLDKITDIVKLKRPGMENETDEFGNEVSVSTGNSVNEFIIHKGFAYIPYNLGGSVDYASFAESGFARVNIQTGETEVISSAQNYSESVNFSVIAGVGDYVYYRGYSIQNNRNGYFRYNIKSGESEKLDGELGKCLSIPFYNIVGVTENAVYLQFAQDFNDINEIQVFDAQTFEPTGVTAELPADKEGMSYLREKVKIYDNKIFVLCENEVIIYSAETGEQISVSSWCSPWDKKEDLDSDGMVHNYVYVQSLDISDDKVYVYYQSDMELKGTEFEKNKVTTDIKNCDAVYCCPVKYVVSGGGSWTKAYNIRR